MSEDEEDNESFKEDENGNFWDHDGGGDDEEDETDNSQAEDVANEHCSSWGQHVTALLVALLATFRTHQQWQPKIVGPLSPWSNVSFCLDPHNRTSYTQRAHPGNLSAFIFFLTFSEHDQHLNLYLSSSQQKCIQHQTKDSKKTETTIIGQGYYLDQQNDAIATTKLSTLHMSSTTITFPIQILNMDPHTILRVYTATTDVKMTPIHHEGPLLVREISYPNAWITAYTATVTTGNLTTPQLVIHHHSLESEQPNQRYHHELPVVQYWTPTPNDPIYVHHPSRTSTPETIWQQAYLQHSQRNWYGWGPRVLPPTDYTPHHYDYRRLSEKSPRIYKVPQFVTGCQQWLNKHVHNLSFQSSALDDYYSSQQETNATHQIRHSLTARIEQNSDAHDHHSLFFDRLTRQILTFLQLDAKSLRTEAWQITQYSRNMHYHYHYDFLLLLPQQITRYMTILLYLNDNFTGGETEFPMANLSVTPQQGSLLIWYNVLPDGNLDTRSLHRAAPVREGTKYIATLFLWYDP